MGIRTLARISWDSWSPLRALGPRTEWPVTPGRRRVPSDPRASCPEQLVELVGPRTQSRFARYSWSPPRAFGPRPQSPGTVGRTRGHLHASASGPGDLVGPAGPRSTPGQLVDLVGPRTWRGVARERWSTPGASRPSASCLAPQFDTVAPRARSRVTLDAGRNRDPSGTGLSRPQRLVAPWTTDQVVSHPTQLAHPTGPREQAGVTPESYVTPRAIGPECDTPGRDGSTRGTSDQGPSGP